MKYWRQVITFIVAMLGGAAIGILMAPHVLAALVVAFVFGYSLGWVLDTYFPEWGFGVMFN